MKISTNTGRVFGTPIDGDGPCDDLSLGQYLLRKLEIFHNKVIFIDGVTGRKWTGAEISKTAKSYATGLIKLIGVKPHDVCCISYDNCDTTALLALAIVLAGGVVCSPFPLDPYPELLYLAKKTEPKFLFCHSRNQSWAERLSQDLNIRVKAILMDNEVPAMNDNTFHIDSIFSNKYENESIKLPVDIGDKGDAVVFIAMSSGTTGKPKAIPTTHENCLVTAKSFVTRGSKDVYSCSATLDYVSSRLILLGAIEAGYTAVIMNGFELTSFLSNVSKYKISVIYLGVAALHTMINYSELDKYDISSLEIIFPMGGKIPSFEDLAKFLEKHPHITHCFTAHGTSEAAGTAVNRLTREQFLKIDPRNCGPLLKYVQLKIVDPDTGALLGTNQKGLIYVKSPSTFKGYYDATYKHIPNGVALENQENIDYRFIKLPGAFDEDGFYNTGDIGYMDDKEELFCLGRMNELMTCRGAKKVLPQELEEIIQELPNVLEVTVLGIPSKNELGVDCPRAFIVLKTNGAAAPKSGDLYQRRFHYAKQINDYVNSIIGWEKQLTGGIMILDEIPRLRSTGKVNKTYLRGLRSSNEAPIYMDLSE